ncbi:MAG TPA: HD domain-containing protein [Anaerolineae bacterium]|nr:HD domain-containing protein [Anaerolineae bacterium]HQK13390.1 HD domain-containing protein [Anaerolineae bacterium]
MREEFLTEAMPPIPLHDPVYGEVTFIEPLFIDLYHADAVQRLKAIYQGGVTAFIRPQRATTRLDHCLGVAALLRRLGADPVEQAAGLLHDAPHTAFSHVVDFVFPNRAHTYHEVHRETMLEGSQIPAICARHELDWHYVTEAENFPLLEQPLPWLCADRLDYFLRDGAVDIGTFSAADAQALLPHLRVWDACDAPDRTGQIVVDDIEAARWLGEQFIHLDDVCWCSVQEVGWYAVMAQALRAALERGLLIEADFMGTDAVLFERLRAANEPTIQRWLALLRPDVDFVRDPTHPDLVALPKVRAVDPPVLVDGHAVPLSHLDAAFARHREAYIASKQGEWPLRIVA